MDRDKCKLIAYYKYVQESVVYKSIITYEEYLEIFKENRRK